MQGCDIQSIEALHSSLTILFIVILEYRDFITHRLRFPDRRIFWSKRNRRLLTKRRGRERLRMASFSFASCSGNLVSKVKSIRLFVGTSTFLFVPPQSSQFPSPRRLCALQYYRWKKRRVGLRLGCSLPFLAHTRVILGFKEIIAVIKINDLMHTAHFCFK